VGTMILPDWPHRCPRPRMTDAQRWLAAHGFDRPTQYRNGAGQSLAEFLDTEPTATEWGTVYPRWTFPDESAVRLGQSCWRITTAGDLVR
jgi:hypothetical protein